MRPGLDEWEKFFGIHSHLVDESGEEDDISDGGEEESGGS